MLGKITRLASRNHPIDFEFGDTGSNAKITLKDSDKLCVPERDFVLLIRDSNINEPTAFYSVN